MTEEHSWKTYLADTGETTISAGELTILRATGVTPDEIAFRKRARPAAEALGIDLDVVTSFWRSPEKPKPAPTAEQTYALSDSDWSRIVGLMPPRGKGGPAVNYRDMVDGALIKFNTRRPWSRIENGRRVRQAFTASIDRGAWQRIEVALDGLGLDEGVAEMVRNVCVAARQRQRLSKAAP